MFTERILTARNAKNPNNGNASFGCESVAQFAVTVLSWMSGSVAILLGVEDYGYLGTNPGFSSKAWSIGYGSRIDLVWACDVAGAE